MYSLPSKTASQASKRTPGTRQAELQGQFLLVTAGLLPFVRLLGQVKQSWHRAWIKAWEGKS